MNTWLPNPYRIVVIGSGLSGLSAAHTLLKHSKIPCQITILEAQNRVGGWLESSRFEDGTVMEHGPRTARSYGNAAIHALNIISELDIDKHIIGIPKSLPAAKNRFIYANKQLCKLPSSLVSLFSKQEPFSKSLISTIAKEPFVKQKIIDDESIYSFFQRRFSTEMAEYMSDPMCKGIFGGDARKLSLRTCFPMLMDYEHNHGSIIKGAIFTKSPKIEETCDIVRKAKEGKWMAWTLKNGISTLPELWSDSLKDKGVQIILNQKCQKISFKSDNKILCSTNDNVYECERVISTVPSCHLDPLLSDDNPKLSELLSKIKYINMAVITLKYENVKLPVDGFGILIPSSEKCDILGITFDSLVIPQHTKDNSTILTVMAGGAWFHELFGSPNTVDTNSIEELAVRSIRDMLGIKESPSKVVCKIHRDCIPQYEVGHYKKVDDIENYIRSNNLPVNIVGNMFGGVGVNDVIVNSRNETLKWLSSNHMY